MLAGRVPHGRTLASTVIGCARQNGRLAARSIAAISSPTRAKNSANRGSHSGVNPGPRTPPSLNPLSRSTNFAHATCSVGHHAWA